jgi:hypothetical protein
VRTFRATLCAALLAPALVVSPATSAAAPQEPSSGSPISLERIREDLEKPPPPRLTPAQPVQLRPTFKTRVDQRSWVPTLEEHLHKQFDLTAMQRQSADWAAKCCGLNIGQFVKIAEDALRARKIRKTREQIARELAELEAASRTSPPK